MAILMVFCYLCNVRLCYRLQKFWVRLCRFRHRCGYGIHSPYAFNKVTGVIYEKGTYYAYAPLAIRHPRHEGGLMRRDLRLLFRLCNDVHPAHALLCTEKEDPVVRDYLHAAATQCQWEDFSPEDAMEHEPTFPIDWLYLDVPDQWEAIARHYVDHVSSICHFVVRGIHRNGESLAAWHRLQANPRVRVTFDLYDFGIACFESRLNKENYIISY